MAAISELIIGLPLILVFGLLAWIISLFAKGEKIHPEKEPKDLFPLAGQKFESCIIELTLFHNSLIIKSDNGHMFEFLYMDIDKLHYSDQQTCLRISGKFLENGEIKKGEKFIYLEKGRAYSILSEINLSSNTQIRYVG